MVDDSPLSTEIESSVSGIRDDLRAAYDAREQALPLCRAAIRFAANCIRAVHRGEITHAEELLGESRLAVTEAAEILSAFPTVLHAGFVHDAQKEFAEASVTLSLVDGRSLPSPVSLGVSGPAYLHGLSESVGELRRYLLDSLRQGSIDSCEQTLAQMDDIYSMLVTVDFPDAMTGNLRRSTDAARGILERTRGDYTLAVQQNRLARQLQEPQTPHK